MGKYMFGRQIKGDFSKIISDDKALDNIVTYKRDKSKTKKKHEKLVKRKK